jgi:hypothetical protein
MEHGEKDETYLDMPTADAEKAAGLMKIRQPWAL